MKKSTITEGLFFITQCVGIGSFFIANITVKSLSTSAWISVLSAALVCGVLIFIINRAKEKCFVKRWFKIICAVFFFCLTVFLCAHFSLVIKMWILPDVSRVFISSGLCFVLFLSLFKDRLSVFYCVVMISLFCILGVIAVRSLIVFGGENIKLFPLFEKERLGVNLIFPFFSVFGIFSSAALLTFAFKPDAQKKSLCQGIFASGAIFILIIESCIVLIGAEQVATSFDTMVMAMKKSDLLGRGDILYFIVWMFFISSAFVSSGNAIKNITGLKTNNRFVYYFFYCLFVLLFSCLAYNIKNLTEVLIFVLGIGSGMIILIMVVIGALERGAEKRNEDF